jgi:hypothetical protein
MPTNLPIRNDATGAETPLLKFYAIAALLVILLIAVEYKAGMFETLTVAESVAKATFTELPHDEVGAFMRAAGPQ